MQQSRLTGKKQTARLFVTMKTSIALLYACAVFAPVEPLRLALAYASFCFANERNPAGCTVLNTRNGARELVRRRGYSVCLAIALAPVSTRVYLRV